MAVHRPVDVLSSPGLFDLATRRAALMRRRRQIARRQWLGTVSLLAVAVWLVSTAFVALLAR